MADPIIAPPSDHNGPPLVDVAKMAIEDALAPNKARLDELLDALTRAKADTPENAGKCADLAKQFKKLRDRVDAVRKDVKEPYAEAGNVVQATANGWFTQIDTAAKSVRAMIQKFDDDLRAAEQKARREQEQRDREERDRIEKQRREDEARAAAAGVKLVEPEPEPEPAPEPVREAPKPVATGDYGAAAHRTVRMVPTVTDPYALPMSILTAPKVTEAILSVVRSMRTGNPDLEIKGIELVPDHSVRIR